MANDHRSVPGLSSGHGAATRGPVGRDPVPLATVRPWDQGRVCLGVRAVGEGCEAYRSPMRWRERSRGAIDQIDAESELISGDSVHFTTEAAGGKRSQIDAGT